MSRSAPISLWLKPFSISSATSRSALVRRQALELLLDRSSEPVHVGLHLAAPALAVDACGLEVAQQRHALFVLALHAADQQRDARRRGEREQQLQHLEQQLEGGDVLLGRDLETEQQRERAEAHRGEQPARSRVVASAPEHDSPPTEPR